MRAKEVGTGQLPFPARARRACRESGDVVPHVAAEGAAREFVRNPVIDQVVAAKHLHAAVAEHVVARADARSNLLSPIELEGVFLDVAPEGRNYFLFEPDPKIEAQAASRDATGPGCRYCR